MEFKIYKRGQGYYTRLYSALVCFGIIVVGCYVLYGKLQVIENIWVKTLVPAGVCAVLGLLVFWLVNRASIADFMISAEGEIKKVSWSSRREIVASTVVVICVVTLMAALLYFTDMAFQLLFRYVVKIY
ncbi:MAG: preprotein translocase subunit SecE [Sedimentisphaerales bacterium]|nr:preprotein translocase subunit SecE [Sedimentisphaerales bacterium]